MAEVYGYWLFFIGVLIGFIGLLLFWSSTLVADRIPLRRGAMTLAAVALPMVLLAVIYRIPVRKGTRRIGVLGVILSVIGAVLMYVYYEELWVLYELDFEIVSIYGIGLLLITVAGLIMPVITPPVKRKVEDEEKPETVEDVTVTRSNALFELYEDKAGEWRWRLVHRNGQIIADCGEGYESKSGAKRAVGNVKNRVEVADTLEISDGAFGVYKDKAGEWRWRLIAPNGKIIADSGEGYSSKGNAKRAVSKIISIEDSEFEKYEDKAGEWRWRLIAPNGKIIADSGEGYISESNLEDAMERVKKYMKKADTLDVSKGAFDVYKDKAGKWRWRLIAPNGKIIADSGEGYSSKQKAVQGLSSVRRNAPNAEVKEKP